MLDQTIYGHHNDTYTYALQFNEMPHEKIQELLFDDTKTEVTPDTWLTQTAGFIASLRNALGEDESEIKSISPTMAPEYSLRVTVNSKCAGSVQDKINAYIRTSPTGLRIV
jgi:hypothetical protein